MGTGEKTFFIFSFSDEEVVCSAARGLILFVKDRVEAVGGIVGEAVDTSKRGNTEESN